MRISAMLVGLALVVVSPGYAAVNNPPYWIQDSPGTSPSARYGHAMAYDAAHGQVVLFGGNTGSGASLRHVGVGRDQLDRRRSRRPARPRAGATRWRTMRRTARWSCSAETPTSQSPTRGCGTEPTGPKRLPQTSPPARSVTRWRTMRRMGRWSCSAEIPTSQSPTRGSGMEPTGPKRCRRPARPRAITMRWRTMRPRAK